MARKLEYVGNTEKETVPEMNDSRREQTESVYFSKFNLISINFE